METKPIARRAVFTKEGSPNLSIVVSQNGEYAVNETGGVIWPRYTPQEMMSGNTPAMNLERAWQTVLAMYPGYLATAIEDAFPEERTV